MTATAHALVGSAIAASISNPAIGLPLAFASHPFLDMIPHWDFGWGWRKKTKLTFFTQSILDLSLGFVLAFLLFGRNMDFTYFVLAVFLSEVWDIIEAPYWFLNWRFPPFSWVYDIQSKIQGRAKLPWGILTQAATFAILVLVIQLFNFS